MPTTPWILWLCGAFLAGSIPFAVLIGYARGVDIRRHGSGNPGATNLGRAVGKRWGLLCFVLDVLKGLLPVLGFAAVLYTQNTPWRVITLRGGHPVLLDTALSVQWVLLAVAAVAGHVFSPWLGFRGGKGVATGLGATLGLCPVVTLPAALAFVLWYAVARISGYVGLASAAAAAGLPVLTLGNALRVGLGPGPTAVFTALTALLAALVIWRHRGNLARIRAGTEPRAGWTRRRRDRAATPPAPPPPGIEPVEKRELY